MRTYTCGGNTARGCGLMFPAAAKGMLPSLCPDCKSVLKPKRSPTGTRDPVHVMASQLTSLRLALVQIDGACGMGNLRLIRAVLDTVEAPGRWVAT